MQHLSSNIKETFGFFSNKVELTCAQNIKIKDIEAHSWLIGKILSWLPFTASKLVEVKGGSKTCYLKAKNFYNKVSKLPNIEVKNENGYLTLVPKKQPVQFQPGKISPQAFEKLKSYGLSDEENQKLEAFCNNKTNFSNVIIPTLIRRQDAQLPRSLVYIPEGSQQGTYALLKTHGKDQEVGRGTFNRVTLAIHLETGEVKVFRNAKAVDIPPQEREVNKTLANQRDKFVVGTPVFYQGPWRNRDLESNQRAREENVDKVGFIMDFVEGGELFDRMGKLGKSDFKETVKIAAECADAIDDLHANGLVHLDLKLENIFMTKDDHPRIGDFGFVCVKGTPILDDRGQPTARGTPGLIPPEMIKAWGYGRYGAAPCKSDFSGDIWSFGCMLAFLLNQWQFSKGELKASWQKANGQHDGDLFRLSSEEDLDRIKDKCFPNRKVAGSYEAIIDRCLQFDPKKRPTAKEVAKMLRELKI